MNIEQYLLFYNSNNADFITTVINDTHNYPLEVINSLKYSPNESSIPSHNTDDCELLLPEPICDYTFCNEDLRHIFPDHNLKICSFNISSVPLHLESLFDQYITPSGVQLDIISLWETRLNDSICNLYNQCNYSPYFLNISIQGGGLAIYVHTKFQGIRIDDACLQLPHIESLFIEIL